MSVLQWSELTPNDRAAVRALAQACLDHDGGLPELVEDEFISRYFFGDDTIAGRDDLGELVAVASLSYAPQPVAAGALGKVIDFGTVVSVEPACPAPPP